MKRIIHIIFFLSLLWSASASGQGVHDEVTIATASTTGVYFQIAYALKKVVQRQSVDTGIKILPLPSEGSDVNINHLLSGKVDFVIVQSDRLYMATAGLGPWIDSGAQALQTVMVLHPEVITLLATEASGIKSLADLNGKRVNIGNQGSGTLNNMKILLKSVGLWEHITYTEKNPVDAIDELINNKIEALFLTVGHPNLGVREATSAAHVRIIPLDDPKLLAAVESWCYLSETRIPADFYLNHQGNLPSVGLRATLVTRADQAEELVYTLTRAVLADQNYFRQLHPCLAELTPQKMLEGLVTPLHSGAQRGFREAGLIK